MDSVESAASARGANSSLNFGGQNHNTKAIAFVPLENFPKFKLEFALYTDTAGSTESTDTRARCTARSLKEQRPFRSLFQLLALWWAWLDQKPPYLEFGSRYAAGTSCTASSTPCCLHWCRNLPIFKSGQNGQDTKAIALVPWKTFQNSNSSLHLWLMQQAPLSSQTPR